MATKRQRLALRIKANKEKINKLKKENIELLREGLLLCDKEQWYIETKETVGRGKNKKECLIGRVHWNEDFIDEDDGAVFTIERRAVVKIDGEWTGNIYNLKLKMTQL